MASVIAESSSSPPPPTPTTLVPPQPCGVDIYPLDRTCDWPVYIAAGWPWVFACFKLTEGLDFEYSVWAERQRRAFLGSARYGDDLFDAFYHFLTLHQDGAAQADRFWNFMLKVGGEQRGTLPAMVDVERGGQKAGMTISRQQVIDHVIPFAQRYKQLSGRLPTLYANELPRSLNVGSRMGCGRSAVAAYGTDLRKYDRKTGGYVGTTAELLAEIGTDVPHTMLWQYRGTDPQTSGPKGYPMTAPGCGAVDINVAILPGGLPALRALAVG